MSSAVDHGSDGVVKAFIDLKYDVNKPDVTVDRLVAEGYGSDEEAATDRYYYEYGYSDIGRTPLMRSVLGKKRKITEMLVGSNANVNAEDCDGLTVLDYALSGKVQPEIVALLVGRGVSVTDGNRGAVESALNRAGLQRLRDINRSNGR